MKMTILAEKKRYTIPLPFFVLRLAGWIICRKWFWRLVDKNIKQVTFPVPLVDKKTIKPILAALKEYRGLTLIDVKDKDGNGVVIRL